MELDTNGTVFITVPEKHGFSIIDSAFGVHAVLSVVLDRLGKIANDDVDVIDAEKFHQEFHSFLKFELVKRVYACVSVIAIGVILPPNSNLTS